MKIAVIGLGFVGEALLRSLHTKKQNKNINLFGYDKYKTDFHDDIKQYICDLNDCLNSDILFTALPTKYSNETKSYDNSPTFEICNYLSENNYKGTILIKSTMEPTTIDQLEKKYQFLQIIHNPEFLRARYAYEDNLEQKYGIILGMGTNTSNESYELVEKMYNQLWPERKIYKCNAVESEITKILSNSYYAIQIQFLTEIYLYTKTLEENHNVDYKNIRNLLNSTGLSDVDVSQIPGPDGKVSYGGLCHPKDTNALLQSMKKNNISCDVLEACINERNKMREDNDNII